MMQNFDEARHKRQQERERELGDRSFIFGNERFEYRPTVRYGVIQAVAALTTDSAGAHVFDVLEEAVFALIEDDGDSLARFKAVCASDEDPITFDDLVELSNWLIEKQVGRPPTPQGSSSDGSERTGTNSTGSLSSEQVEALRT